MCEVADGSIKVVLPFLGGSRLFLKGDYVPNVDE